MRARYFSVYTSRGPKGDPGSNTVILRKNTGLNIGNRPRINLIEGTNIIITVTDDIANDELDVVIDAIGGGLSESHIPFIASAVPFVF